MKNTQQLARRIEVASGRVKADLVLKNANVVDIFCHRVIKCDVAIADGIIVGLGQYDGLNNVDCSGKYVMPSFFDTHLHFESSMSTPNHYLWEALAKGVTTLNADPHEIANVCGKEGIDYMIDCTADSPIDVNFMLPSCVPATPFEHGNAVFTAKDIKEMFVTGKFFGLAEMMNYPGVIYADKEVLEKISTASICDGHAPQLTGNQLNAYLCTGIVSDHECESVEEVYEKVSKGMYVMIREGSQTKNLSTLIGAINDFTKRRLMFCTDDRYIGEVVESGTIQNCVIKAVEKGIDIYDALTIASLNAYECYKIPNKGAVSINYRADLIVADDIVPRNILQVYKNGKLVAENGKSLYTPKKVDDSKVTNTVRIKPLTASKFLPKFTPNKTPVMQILKDTVVTKTIYTDSAEGLNMCAVIERHNATGNIGTCWVKGFNLKNGAIAQTVGHDSHNITVLGDNTEDMLLAVNALGSEGGMALVVNGKVEYVFKLDIAGLMSSKNTHEVIVEHHTLMEKTKALNINPEIAPYMLLSFLSLIVIPEIKITDRGLFDVAKFNFFEE